MKKILLLVLGILYAAASFAWEREAIWPKGQMPDSQGHQIAAMTNETSVAGFNPDEHRVAYLEWYDAPDASVDNDACMILLSGGAYNFACDVECIEEWRTELTARGIQCVNLVYRTPRPNGLSIYQSAWEDGQRGVRLVRSEAAKRGFDPDRIGVIGMSAGSHLALLLAANSLTPAYDKKDALDDIPCNVNWAILNSPAYVTNDSESGTPSSRQGYGTDVKLSDVFKFDSNTCPMSLHHGGLDPYSPNGSTLIYRQLRKMGIPAEVHLYPDEGHKPMGLDRAIEFMTQMGFLGKIAAEESLGSRFAFDVPNVDYCKEFIWPEGRMPNVVANQSNAPYIEWYVPKNLKTKAIQIIYSGGSYMGNDPNGFEVAPVRKYLNQNGMAVVTMYYRCPRPEGLAKHTTAWQDLQRAIRMVRSEANSRGLDPDRIGIMGSSAGGHLTLMGVTSSKHQSYLPIDVVDRQSPKVQWGVAIYPAYVLSDGYEDANTDKGNSDEYSIAPEFSFDLDTAPMLFIHGDADIYSTMGSVRVWEKMRSMGIQSEVHTLATRNHGFNAKASPNTGSYTYIDRIWEFLSKKGFL